jgi:hypothetical protein
MPKQKQANAERRFLAMWDCNGLESLIDITGHDHDAMMAGLKGETFKTPYNISMMIMRAKFNTQRSYEIYAFTTEDDIDYDTVLDMFKHSPQVIVNAIRKNGHMIHSDYNPNEKRVIV